MRIPPAHLGSRPENALNKKGRPLPPWCRKQLFQRTGEPLGGKTGQRDRCTKEYRCGSHRSGRNRRYPPGLPLLWYKPDIKAKMISMGKRHKRKPCSPQPILFWGAGRFKTRDIAGYGRSLTLQNQKSSKKDGKNSLKNQIDKKNTKKNKNKVWHCI